MVTMRQWCTVHQCCLQKCSALKRQRFVQSPPSNAPRLMSCATCYSLMDGQLSKGFSLLVETSSEGFFPHYWLLWYFVLVGILLYSENPWGWVLWIFAFLFKPEYPHLPCQKALVCWFSFPPAAFSASALWTGRVLLTYIRPYKRFSSIVVLHNATWRWKSK